VTCFKSDSSMLELVIPNSEFFMFSVIVICGYMNDAILRSSSKILIFSISEDYTEGCTDDYMEYINENRKFLFGVGILVTSRLFQSLLLDSNTV